MVRTLVTTSWDDDLAEGFGSRQQEGRCERQRGEGGRDRELIEREAHDERLRQN